MVLGKEDKKQARTGRPGPGRVIKRWAGVVILSGYSSAGRVGRAVLQPCLLGAYNDGVSAASPITKYPRPVQQVPAQEKVPGDNGLTING